MAEGPKADAVDIATFTCPAPISTNTIIIEFCNRMVGSISTSTKASMTMSNELRVHRATWVQTELFLTFTPSALGCISLFPRDSDESAGRFRVWVVLPDRSESPQLVWDRKVEGGFPELKILKQRIRDIVQPGRSLGHSDRRAETGD